MAAEVRMKVGGLELATGCEAGLERDARGLLEMLGGAAGGGERLADGWRRWIGWSMVTLRGRGRELVVCEPDFAGDPFQGVREDVTITLRQMRSMAAVFALAKGAQPTRCTFKDTILFERGWRAAPRLVARRGEEPVGEFSGWTVRPDPRPAGGDFEYGSLFTYELLGPRPELLGALELPPGYEAVFEGGRIAEVHSPSRAAPPGRSDWFERAQALAAEGKDREAMECLERSLVVDPWNRGLWHLKADQLLFTFHRYEDALATYDRSLRCGEDTGARSNRGVALVLLGRAEEGLASIDRALEIEDQASIWTIKAWCLARLGRTEESRACEARTRELDPAGESIARTREVLAGLPG